MNTRRTFLVTGLAIAGGTGIWSSKAAGQDAQQDKKPEPIERETVARFVGKSHGDLETVKAMVGKQKALVNATWDWGNGDFETGLGAASHVGRPDIAEFLLNHGARLDIFAATMLGIKPMLVESLKVFPKIHSVPGPHGISMLSHAIVGRDSNSIEVVELLLSAGADVNAESNLKMTPLMAASGVGKSEIVNILLDHGAKPTSRDSQGRTALDIARKREHQEVVQLLENAISNSNDD